MSKLLKKLGRYGKKSVPPPMPPTPDYNKQNLIGALNLETNGSTHHHSSEKSQVILCEEYEDPFDLKTKTRCRSSSNNNDDHDDDEDNHDDDDDDENGGEPGYESSGESYYTSPYESQGTPTRYSRNPSPSESKDSELLELYDYPISEGSTYDDVCCSCLTDTKKGEEVEEPAVETSVEAKERFVPTIISKIESLSQDYEKKEQLEQKHHHQLKQRVSSGQRRIYVQKLDSCLKTSSSGKEQRRESKRKRSLFPLSISIGKNTSLSSRDSLVSTDDTGSGSISSSTSILQMATTKSKSSRGQQIYETAFDSKLSNQTRFRLDRGGSSSSIEKALHKTSLHNLLYPNSGYSSSKSTSTQRRGSESSNTSFTPEHSSRSSTASSCSSHGSTTSTPQHLNQLPRAFQPKSKLQQQQQLPGSCNVNGNGGGNGVVKLSSFRIPRSKSSDFNLSRLSTTAIPEHCNVIKSETRSKLEVSTKENGSCSSSRPPSAVTPTNTTNSSNGHLKVTTSDTISSFESIYDSDTSSRCLLGCHEKRNQKYKNLINNNMSENEEKKEKVVVKQQRDKVEPIKKPSREHLNLILSPATTVVGGSSVNNMSKPDKDFHSGSQDIGQTSNSTKTTSGLSPSSSKLNLILKKNLPPLTSGGIGHQLQSPQNDSRPLNDYDAPWDSNKRLSTMVTRIINTVPASSSASSQSSANDKCYDGSSVTVGTKSVTPTLDDGPTNDSEEALKSSSAIGTSVEPTGKGWSSNECIDSGAIRKEITVKHLNETSKVTSPSSWTAPSQPPPPSAVQQPLSSSAFPVTPDVPPQLSKPKLCIEKPELRPTTRPGLTPGLSLNLNLNISNNGTDGVNGTTTNTTTNSSTSSAKSRKQLGLNFPPIPLQTTKVNIDVTIPLEKQGWFHGTITRLDAENLLRSTKEGSFLVRNCESSKQDYSLSLKSAKGFMHMKIVKESDGGKYVLGLFSKPFTSIPDMVHHYSLNKLPIRGAEHMSLLHPIIDQLL